MFHPEKLRTWTDILVTTLAPIIWGSTYIITTEILPPDRPLIAAVLRTLPAGLLLVIFSRIIPDKKHWGRLLILAGLNISFFQALLFLAAYRLPGGLAAVLGAIQPLAIMGLVWVIDGKQPGRAALTAGILGMVGMAALLLSAGTVHDTTGIIAALLGAACMATGTYLTKRWNLPLPLLAFTGWQLLLGGLLLLPVAWAIDPPLPTLTTAQIFGYAYLTIFGALVAYVLWFRGINRLPPVAVSSLGLLSPVSAVIFGWALLNQSIQGTSLLGMVTVLVSILVLQWVTTGNKLQNKGGQIH